MRFVITLLGRCLALGARGRQPANSRCASWTPRPRRPWRPRRSPSKAGRIQPAPTAAWRCGSPPGRWRWRCGRRDTWTASSTSMARRDPWRSRSFRGWTWPSGSRSGLRSCRTPPGRRRSGPTRRGRPQVAAKRLPPAADPAGRGGAGGLEQPHRRAGGGPDENLTVMDGVEIHIRSGFRPDQRVQPRDRRRLRALDEGFSAVHGDRLSPLLIVNPRWLRGEALAGTAALPLPTRTPSWRDELPGGWDPGCSPAAAPTTTSWPSGLSTRTCPPSTSQARLYSPGRGRTLTVFGLRRRQAGDASFDRPEAGATARLRRTRNDVVAATLQAPLGGRGGMRTTASAYTNTDVVDFGGDFRNQARRSNAPGVQPSPAAASNLPGTPPCGTTRSARSDPAGGRAPGAGGRDRAAPPAHARPLHDPRRANPHRRHLEPGRRRGPAGRAGLVASSTRLGAWLQDRVNLSSRLTLQAGLRFDHSP